MDDTNTASTEAEVRRNQFSEALGKELTEFGTPPAAFVPEPNAAPNLDIPNEEMLAVLAFLNRLGNELNRIAQAFAAVGHTRDLSRLKHGRSSNEDFKTSVWLFDIVAEILNDFPEELGIRNKMPVRPTTWQEEEMLVRTVSKAIADRLCELAPGIASAKITHREQLADVRGMSKVDRDSAQYVEIVIGFLSVLSQGKADFDLPNIDFFIALAAALGLDELSVCTFSWVDADELSGEYPDKKLAVNNPTESVPLLFDESGNAYTDMAFEVRITPRRRLKNEVQTLLSSLAKKGFVDVVKTPVDFSIRCGGTYVATVKI